METNTKRKFKMTHYDAFFFASLWLTAKMSIFRKGVLICGFGPRPLVTDLFVALIITTEVLAKSISSEHSTCSVVGAQVDPNRALTPEKRWVRFLFHTLGYFFVVFPFALSLLTDKKKISFFEAKANRKWLGKHFIKQKSAGVPRVLDILGLETRILAIAWPELGNQCNHARR